MSDYRLLIDGESVVGDGSLDVIDPATEEVFATCSRASEAQLNRAISSAKSAFGEWSSRSIDERRAVLNEVADIATANAEELGRILTLEQGKPLSEGIAEIHGFAMFTRFFAAMDLPVEVLEDGEARRVEAHRIPLGPVAAIIPWNFPIILLGFKFAPALIAGNTLVVKPAPTTPLATLRLGELIKDVVPPGVVNIIADANDLGPALTAHPDIRKVSFIYGQQRDRRTRYGHGCGNVEARHARNGRQRCRSGSRRRRSERIRSEALSRCLRKLRTDLHRDEASLRP
jgi:acyl-CoA reductase-like NAD-dependent aldehyde dehydrogenase